MQGAGCYHDGTATDTVTIRYYHIPVLCNRGTLEVAREKQGHSHVKCASPLEVDEASRHEDVPIQLEDTELNRRLCKTVRFYTRNVKLWEHRMLDNYNHNLEETGSTINSVARKAFGVAVLCEHKAHAVRERLTLYLPPSMPPRKIRR